MLALATRKGISYEFLHGQTFREIIEIAEEIGRMEKEGRNGRKRK